MITITERKLLGAIAKPSNSDDDYITHRIKHTNSKSNMRRFGMLLDRHKGLANAVEGREVMVMNNETIINKPTHRVIYTVIKTPVHICTVFDIDALDELGYGRITEVVKMLNDDMLELSVNDFDNDIKLPDHSILQVREKSYDDLSLIAL